MTLRSPHLLAALLVTSVVHAAPPLPPSPIRLVIDDPAAFDAALTGRFREALSGSLPDGEPVAAGFRASRIGAKLEDQWGKFAKDLPWTWSEIRRLRPTSLGIAVLDIGALEAVLVVQTPLASLPLAPPSSVVRTHEGSTYNFVAAGAADEPGAGDASRRAGLAWQLGGGRLILATSERAMKLALDASRSSAPPVEMLAGLASLDLDMEKLAADRYFGREFLFGGSGARSHVRAALRLEGGRLVEVREGTGGSAALAATFAAPGAAAAGWLPLTRADSLLDILRGALLEPVPSLSRMPLVASADLPPTKAQEAEDAYAVRIDKPRTTASGASSWEVGELDAWRKLLAANPPSGFGYDVARDGTRRVAFAWPKEKDADIARLIAATLTRRGARIDQREANDITEIRIGPGLPAIAWRRTGGFLWLGASAAALATVPTPQPAAELLRWGRLDLEAVAAEARRWESAEGPASPETIRPFSDRILGLLGWLPETKALSVERRKTVTGWTERVVFEPR
jgi:hypothetical protein